jgi:general secretion pathway protein A
MMEKFYGLSGPPFKLSPDPRFFYGSRSHSKAMSYLRYGLQQGEGFVVITGGIGAGKSTLIAHLLEGLDHKRITAGHLVTSNLDADEAVRLILQSFQIKPRNEGKAAGLQAFESYLLNENKAGRRVLLIVDEAQNLPDKTIEELRMLSNFSVGGQPLFQCFLVGQPQFRDLIAHPNFEQLRQRVIASYHLESLSEEETREYIEHRLRTVGWSGRPTINEAAFQRIHEETAGVPRRINNFCSRLMLYGALEELDALDIEAVEVVAEDLRGEVVGDFANERPVAVNDTARHEVHEIGKDAAPAAAQPNGNASSRDLEERIELLESMLSRLERRLSAEKANGSSGEQAQRLKDLEKAVGVQEAALRDLLDSMLSLLSEGGEREEDIIAEESGSSVGRSQR